jgi:hypothetical protein
MVRDKQRNQGREVRDDILAMLVVVMGAIDCFLGGALAAHFGSSLRPRVCSVMRVPLSATSTPSLEQVKRRTSVPAKEVAGMTWWEAVAVTPRGTVVEAVRLAPRLLSVNSRRCRAYVGPLPQKVCRPSGTFTLRPQPSSLSALCTSAGVGSSFRRSSSTS